LLSFQTFFTFPAGAHPSAETMRIQNQIAESSVNQRTGIYSDPFENNDDLFALITGMLPCRG
ncbi:MAG: hypothetical protein N0C86_20070, partial [Candidatus Thiodiazotropha taylori]|nr:hypothetical protein [Candidatus Thiodiazotropha taylori]MCW4328300.1 hypothetical protein [Candidatus Thiodiazotropha taylori]